MWADAIPNLLIGLREGLEAGLVVSILLAALRKVERKAEGGAGRRGSSAPVWLGVLGAVMLAGSFAAVLTYSTDVLSSRAQEAVGGLLSVFAVALVTGMVFWMRRTAAGLAAHLRGEVARAAAIGAGALTITAFLAVGREGLETTLFLWAAVRASGATFAPLFGAGLGLAAAVVVCWLLYRRAVRLNVGVFFNRTAIALIVIAAGVLSYGLGDLQDASLLPGQHWIAFDLTAHVDPGSWWVSIVTGVTELAPKMTVLQVVAWAAYLVVVIPLFVRAAARVPASGSRASGSRASALARWERLAAQRTWTIAGALVAVPAVAAGVLVAALPAAGATDAVVAVTVARDGCARDFRSAQPGTQTFAVSNQSGRAGEINLDDAAGGVVAEIETLGPATTANMSATLGSGTYTIKCILSGQPVTSSAPVQVSAAGGQAASDAASGAVSGAVSVAVKPVTVAELTGPNQAYRAYAAHQLTALAGAVTTIRADLGRGDLAAARRDWLAAQLDWERVGASYDSFGDDGVAVDGLPDGRPAGVNDPGFTGLHRLEYGLWHNQSAASLRPAAAALARDVATVRQNLTSADLAGDPTNLPLRAHEILEDALRDHLSGLDDQGSGAAYPQTYADLQVTRVILGELSALINARAPKLLPAAQPQLDAVAQALLATRADGQWQPAGSVPLLARQQVDAAIGALLETLSRVPDLLEVAPTP
jgi:high-affinity iron transporter